MTGNGRPSMRHRQLKGMRTTTPEKVARSEGLNYSTAHKGDVHAILFLETNWRVGIAGGSGVGGRGLWG